MNVAPLALLINVLPEPTLLVTGHGAIVAANPPALTLFQLSPNAVQSQTLASLVANTPDQLAGYLDLWSRNRQLMPTTLLVRTGSPTVAVTGEGNTQEVNVARYRCLGAVIQPWSAQGPALLLLRLEQQAEANSHFSLLTQKIAELSKEVRERLAVEQALRTSEERFRTVVEAAPNTILVVDAGGRIVLANPQAETLLDCKRQELLGQAVEQFIPPRLRIHHEAYRAAFREEPSARPMGAGRDLYIQQRNGSEVPVEIGLNPFTTVKGTFVLVSIIDIRARRQAEQQLQESEARLRELNATLEQRVRLRTTELERSNDDLDQFAYVASHDLKAPLRHIDQLATWIVEDAGTVLPPVSQKHLAQLRQRVKRMERLLDDLLTYARIGRTEGEVEVVTVDALLDDIIYLLAPPPGFVIEKGEMPTLYTVRTPLGLVFRNLISNAIKHHHQPSQGFIRITSDVAGQFVKFNVQDNGPGIEPQYHERIFGMFQTLRSRDQVEGSGMGLAIVKKAVERHGGTITIKSAVGAGTTFAFTWPQQMSL